MSRALQLLITHANGRDFISLKRHLLRHGLNAECTWLEKPADLPRLLQEKCLDAVIGDTCYPELDFQDLFIEVQTGAADMPFVLVSASVHDEDAIESIKRGVWDFAVEANMVRLDPPVEIGASDGEPFFDDPLTEAGVSEPQTQLQTGIDCIDLGVVSGTTEVSLAHASHGIHTKHHRDYLTHHDPLTDLPNRTLLLARLQHTLERARRSGKPAAVLFVGLDAFQAVNQKHGQSAGDELLKLVGQRLQRRWREMDTLARYGGDEFVVVLEDLSSANDAAALAEDAMRLVGDPFRLSGGEILSVTCSIGVSIFPRHGDGPARLIQAAHGALLSAKTKGGGMCHVQQESPADAPGPGPTPESRLQNALEQDELILLYQPLVLLDSERIYGVEALVRWQNPFVGLVSPEHFIPLAEETGLIVPLGNWVLRAACRQMKQWRDAGLYLDSVSVNLSSQQFMLPDFPEQVAAILLETGLPPSCLELEITERGLLEAGELVERHFADLTALGIRISVDDFGTGYSSLAFLKRTPIHTLKVDLSFVQGIPGNAADTDIATTVVTMARNLGMQALAEGVETEAQFEFLKTQGCRYGQGYFFSKPLSTEQTEALLKSVQGTGFRFIRGG